MRISDWSSDVCSSDLETLAFLALAARRGPRGNGWEVGVVANVHHHVGFVVADRDADPAVVMQRDAGLGLTVGADEVTAGCGDRKSVVEGKGVSGRVDLGGRRIIKKKNLTNTKN